DGIRDFHVTGVQTCALPIFRWWSARSWLRSRSFPASFRLTPFLPATSGRANPTVGAPLEWGDPQHGQNPWVEGRGCDEPAAPKARSTRIQTVTPRGRSVLGGESQRPKLRSEALTHCLPGRSHENTPIHGYVKYRSWIRQG